MKSLIIDCLSQSDEINKNIVQSFVEKLENEGSTTKIHSIRDLEINPCFACTAQYTFKYGEKCRCEDDMNRLLPDFREYNNWIFVSKIDRNGGLEYLRNVLDRMEPLFQPISETNEDDVSIIDLEIDGNIMLIGIADNQQIDFVQNVIRHLDSTAMLFNKHYASTILVDVDDLEKYEDELESKIKLLLNNEYLLVEEEVVV